MFMARVSDKAGRCLLEGEPRETREEAARFVFRARETAKSCSTAKAVRDPGTGNWRTWGMNMQWHKRRDILPDVPEPCDVGMFGDAAKQSALF
jgi:hypothetical protein